MPNDTSKTHGAYANQIESRELETALVQDCASMDHEDQILENGCCDTCGTWASQVVWCENVNAPAHGNGLHRPMSNCRNPHSAYRA